MIDSIINELKIFAKHLTILVVEDDKELSTEIVDLLSVFFKEVYYAQDGKEALSIYKKRKCDIVLTDINMPKMNGIELSREIRTLDKKQIIIVLSGYIDTFVVDLIDIGIQTLLIKPYEHENFLQKLLVHCENLVFAKDFTKLKLDKSLKNYVNPNIIKDSNQEKKHITLTENVIDDYISNTSITQGIDNYIESFDIKEEVDHNLWKHMSNDILEINESFEEVIDRIMLNNLTDDTKDELVNIFEKYNSSLHLLPGLEKFGSIFKELAVTLDDYDLADLPSEHIHIFDMFQYFHEDIINYFNIVFVEKSTKDINYLTDSIESSIFELKVKLGIEQFNDDQELELF